MFPPLCPLQTRVATQYFWDQEVPKNISYYKYDTPQAMIDGLKYKPKDRWSVVITKRQNSNF